MKRVLDFTIDSPFMDLSKPPLKFKPIKYIKPSKLKLDLPIIQPPNKGFPITKHPDFNLSDHIKNNKTDSVSQITKNHDYLFIKNGGGSPMPDFSDHFIDFSGEPNKVEVVSKILDHKGNPIENAAIKVLGTSMGTTSDARGKFRIEVDRDSVLQITHVSFQSREINSIDVDSTLVMLDKTEQLEEVSLTVKGKPKSSKNRKLIYLGIGVIGVVGISYLIIKSNQNKQVKVSM